jgi:hypothetical protein|tara:strand:+ start:621 stop:1136 length:516 start_codon:yes stop_codon:yes gene_type:complete
MVVTSLIKNILPIAVVGLGLAFLYNVVAKPGEASKSAEALSATLSGFGTGIGQVGTGIGSALGSIGAGSAGLLDPLFSLKTLVYGENAQALSTSDASSVSIRTQEQELTASSTLIDDPVVNTASDQPGVTPQSPASETAVPQVSTARFPGARVATTSEQSLLSSLTGGLLG